MVSLVNVLMQKNLRDLWICANHFLALQVSHKEINNQVSQERNACIIPSELQQNEAAMTHMHRKGNPTKIKQRRKRHFSHVITKVFLETETYSKPKRT